MKKVLTLIAITLSFSSYACVIPSELNNGSLYQIFEEENYTDLQGGEIELTPQVRLEVGKVEDISHCSDENITISSFSTISGQVFHAVYTSEDICDGGNSYGAVLDENSKAVAHIGDGDFYCID